MANDFECPHCEAPVDSGDIPDHVADAMEDGTGKFLYECACGCEFEVHVEYNPNFTVYDDAIKKQPNPVDELYAEAVEHVVTNNKASASFVQRCFQIGYNRAARLIDRMEREGIVSEWDDVGKCRRVLKPTTPSAEVR